MPQFSIGTFNFVNMSVFPLGHKQQVEMESRPGVDGLYFWLTGERGQQFTVETFVDVANVFAAGTIFTQYEKLIGKVVPVVWSDNYMPKQYVVIDVVPIPEGIRQIILGVGGVSGISYGICTAAWTLAAAPLDLLPPEADP